LKKVGREILEGLDVVPAELADQVLRVALDLEKPAEFMAEGKVEQLVPAVRMADIFRQKVARPGSTSTVKH
jgi:hypothetical protein